MQSYLAILDYAHLDNPMFLKTFADSLARHTPCPGMIVHGDSAYTERLIQTGMTSHDARLRGIKDLNNRLVALLADSGVPGIGMHGYQRKMVTVFGEQITVDRSFFSSLPARTVPVLSSLAYDTGQQAPMPVSLPQLAEALNRELGLDRVLVFNKQDRDPMQAGPARPPASDQPDAAGQHGTPDAAALPDQSGLTGRPGRPEDTGSYTLQQLPSGFLQENVPDELHELTPPYHLITPEQMSLIPEIRQHIHITP